MSQGKGDDQRPARVSDAELEANWRRTFGRTTRRKSRPGQVERDARRIGQLELLPCPMCPREGGAKPAHVRQWQPCEKHRA